MFRVFYKPNWAVKMSHSHFFSHRTVTFWGIVLGWFAFLGARIWFVSFVPTWWTNQTNSVVLAVGAVATLDKIVSGIIF